MISAWDIYWVMQLDTIGMAMGTISVFGLIVVAVVWGAAACEIRRLWGYLVAVAVTGVWFVCLLAAIFLPSTKTAAAMFVIPAVANNETIQKEAGDLYKLAKQALREAVDAPKDEAKE